MFNLHHIIQTLPRDPASLFALALTAVAVVFIVYVSRSDKHHDEGTKQS